MAFSELCFMHQSTIYFSFLMLVMLQGEDLIRESGIPYTIVRPCALTEEPAGADLIFEQGDNITVLASVPSMPQLVHDIIPTKEI